MTVRKNKAYLFLCIALIAVLLLGLAGCSKEAKTERHWKKGESYFTENRLKEAIIEYKNVIKLKPDHAQAYYKLGLSYLRMGMIRDAYGAILKSVELDRQHA